MLTYVPLILINKREGRSTKVLGSGMCTQVDLRVMGEVERLSLEDWILLH